MDPEVEARRPPSSYGSMKSESEVDEEGEGSEEELAELCASNQPLEGDLDATGLGFNRSSSPDTQYTASVQQSQPPGAIVIDTRCSDEDNVSNDPEDLDEPLFADSPEPPEPVEPDEPAQSDAFQPGRLHPEQDLPHIFKRILSVLTRLSREELIRFKMWFHQWKTGITLQHTMEGDVLDFVDKLMEVLGLDQSLLFTIRALEYISKVAEAEEVQTECGRALARVHLKQRLLWKHQVIYEGVAQAGKQNPLDKVYVEPVICIGDPRGVNPAHEYRATGATAPLQDAPVGLNNLFRQEKNGRPVRTVLTTGIPGIGMTVSVGKFCLDWAQQHANRDFQFVIKLPFHKLWVLRNRMLPGEETSVMEVIRNHHPVLKDMKYLEEDGCRFLIVMDSFDCYQAPLDWENAPVITDSHAQAHLDVLIVNIVRGSVLGGASVWILGRMAAVLQIPSRFIDIVTEIRGFSDQMVDDYLSRRFDDDELAASVLAHYKLQPTLRILAHQPFVCWIVATVLERCCRRPDFGSNPPRLTPFYVNILIVQMNRRLMFYRGRSENDLKWSSEDHLLLTRMGQMALKMLEADVGHFFEEDVEASGYTLAEVVVMSGLCTELPSATADGRKTFCFSHFTFQEFMAALYVFTVFHNESKNILASGPPHLLKRFPSRDQSQSVVGLVQSAVDRSLASPLGRYGMFLRFLCGLLSPECHGKLQRCSLLPRSVHVPAGLDRVQQLLEKTLLTAPEERRDNLRECLRELTQKDE